MSRLRKGNKYKGGCFAGQFKSAMTMKSPLYESEFVAKQETMPAVAGETPTEPSTENSVDETKNDLQKSGAADATVKNLGPDDKSSLEDKEVIDTQERLTRGRGLEARKAWKLRNQQKQEDDAKAAAEEKAAAEAAEEAKTYRSESGEKVFRDDFESGSKGKERRKEHRSNKAEIKAARKAGDISKKEAKSLRKSSKTLKKSNRKAKKAAKKKAKRARKGK